MVSRKPARLALLATACYAKHKRAWWRVRNAKTPTKMKLIEINPFLARFAALQEIKH